MKTIDLTHPINTGVLPYPGDPDFVVKNFASYENNVYNLDIFSINSHFGTHIDFQFHTMPKGKKSSDYSIEKFMGKGKIIDIDISQNREINLNQIKDKTDEITDEKILLLKTGWHKRYNTQEYYSKSPYLSEEAAEYIADSGINILALDFPDPDKNSLICHNILLSRDVLIAENINNTHLLNADSEYYFALLPLNIEAADGCPIRAVAIKNK